MSKNRSKITGITIISYIELLDRFNYYALQSLLVLYLNKKFNFVDNQSYEIFGIYAALPFALSIIGGLISDRWLGFYHALVIGSILTILGNLFLLLPNIEFLYCGLSFIMMGVGLLKPNNSNLIGEFYKENSEKRDRAYSLFYLCINLGSILGPLSYGILSQQAHYSVCFIVAATLTSSSLAALFYIKKILDHQEIPKIKFIKASLSIILSIFITYLVFHYRQCLGLILLITFIFALTFLLRSLKKNSEEYRQSILRLLIPTVACIIIFAAVLQIYSSCSLYIDRNIYTELIGFQIPTIWFSTVEPICIFFMVPILNSIWKKWSLTPEKKISVGLFAGSISFFIFGLMTISNQEYPNISLILILLSNIFLAIGEICTIPITISLINLMAPKNNKSSYMGAFYFSLTLSGYLSMITSQLGNFTQIFMDIFWILLISGILVFCFSLKNKKTIFNIAN